MRGSKTLIWILLVLLVGLTEVVFLPIVKEFVKEFVTNRADRYLYTVLPDMLIMLGLIALGSWLLKTFGEL